MGGVAADPLLGVALHAVGGFFAATCYTPQKKVQGWSWQTYWLTQAAFCWFLLPIAGAMLTIPHLWEVLSEAPRSAMLNSFLLGMAYGVGGTAFGIAIRYIGFSLTYAIAVGLSSVVGTLVPPIRHGILGDLMSRAGAGWVVAGVVVGTIGIAICGWAGRLKEVDLREGGNGAKQFSLGKGLALAILAGFLSAVYGISLDEGQRIADVAREHGAGVFEGNVIYIFSNTGAFLTTAVYCLYLGVKHRTLGEFTGRTAARAPLPRNFILSILTGLFWYGQFFFYNLGHVRMGTYKFSSWAIHMIMLVLISNLVGVLFREWKGCRGRTRLVIGAALVVLVGAVLLITVGNYLGQKGGAG